MSSVTDACNEMSPSLTLGVDAEALDGRLLFAIPKKGLSVLDRPTDCGI